MAELLTAALANGFRSAFPRRISAHGELVRTRDRATDDVSGFSGLFASRRDSRAVRIPAGSPAKALNLPPIAFLANRLSYDDTAIVKDLSL